MADTTLTVSVNADTSGLDSITSAVSALNQALGYTKIAANDTTKPVQELFGALQSSSDKAIAGLIRGQESWRQAMVNVLQDMEIKFVQLNANKLINDLETDVLGVQSAQTAAAQKIAAGQSAATAGSAANAGGVLRQIESDAAATYAGVYAFFSPVLGPAAAIPAGVSAGAVAAMEGLVSLDVGAWDVPSDMPAYLHAGEMVVPENFASGMRGAGGFSGGGDSYTINVNAIDTQTGAQFLKNNASVIASSLSSQARNFNRNLPVWKS